MCTPNSGQPELGVLSCDIVMSISCLYEDRNDNYALTELVAQQAGAPVAGN